MRKSGLISAIVGVGTLVLGVLLRVIANLDTWLWIPGVVLMAGGTALVLWSRFSASAAAVPVPRNAAPVGVETARLLDNFEQRFAELKGRKPNATVLSDLYTLGNQLERRGRAPQATAVYRHLARFDNTYRDVGDRLKRLMDAERAKPKSAPPAAEKRAANAAPLNTPVKPLPAPATAAGVPEGGAASPETQRLGRYQLEREIGRGAMGIVYLGRDTAINRLVAIKAIPLASEFSDAELVEARARFFREAETAGRLNHPNIVTIYDVGEERGLAYIAMEYLKGRHLSDYAKSNNLMEPRKVLDVIGRTAAALGFAHKQQVVHRDIKPANLMYDPSTDVLKITDFGIARLSGAGSTRTGIVLGTPSFMSPEQLEGRTVTGHSDLFSLGVSLFQLLTGQLPFTADSMTGLMQQIAEAPHPPLRAFRPDLPECVESVIDRALAKSPDARYDSGAQMAAAWKTAGHAYRVDCHDWTKAMSLKGKIASVALTDTGKVREHNEDMIGTEADIGLFVLADGMGGYNAGEVASGIAVKTIINLVRDAIVREDLSVPDADTGLTRPSIILRDAIHRANKIIYHTSKTQPQCEGMGTTVVACLFHDNKMSIAHVGDSRLYRLRDNRFEQMTLDHSLLQELVDRGFYSQQEAQRATNKNYVTRALGVEQNVDVEIHEQPVQKSDYYVLCSDGLSDMIEDEDIHLTISTFSANLDTVAKQLIQLSNDNGGRDNVSVIMAHVAEPFPAHRRIFDKILGWFG